MYPPRHAAVGYLAYVVYAALTNRRLPARWALPPLLLATQLPDLIDKLLAYYGILAYGRSLAHSIFTFVILAILVWKEARQRLYTCRARI